MTKITVNTQKPYRIIFTLEKHPVLGYLVYLNAVQLLDNGMLGLASQKIFMSTAKDFNLSANQLEALALIEQIEPETAINKVIKSRKSKNINTFLEKELDEDKLAIVREYIEKYLIKILPLIKGNKVYMADSKGFLIHPITYNEEKADILFHFRRNLQATHYFITMRLGSNKINFYQNNSDIVVSNPAWVLADNKLFTFNKNADGNKIRPFLTKKFIAIPKSNEAVYYEKFIAPLIENNHVYAEGFQILTEQHRATPILKLVKLNADELGVLLHFKYDVYTFPYHSLKKVSVKLEKLDEQYVFHRIKRSTIWEESQKELLIGMGLHLYEGSIFISDIKSSYHLLEILKSNLSVLEENGFKIIQDSIPTPYFLGESTVDFNLKEQGDWFDIHGEVSFGKYKFKFIQLKNHLLKGIREFILPDNTVAIIPQEWFANYTELFELGQVQNEKISLHKHHFGWVDALSETTPALQLNVPEFNDSIHYPLPVGFNGSLRPYQLQGYYWLRFMCDNGLGACLADDMGLGKTIQMLVYLQSLKENVTDNHLPHLIVVPTALIYNWQSEVNKFTKLSIWIHLGAHRKKKLNQIGEKYDIIITSYGTLRNDINLLKDVQFHTIILDESQAIKNPQSTTAQCVQLLNGKQRFAITGTPIENSIMDLWSQFNFLNKGLLGNHSYFTNKFLVPIQKNQNKKQETLLKKMVNPFILRRTKEQVADFLPPKTEQIHLCSMTEEQYKAYDTVKSMFRNKILNNISEVGLSKSKLLLLQGLTQLRLIANHPILNDETFEGESGKFIQVVEMLHKTIKNNHKILVFSQFTKHLALYTEYFDVLGVPYLYLDGATSALERQQRVDTFQQTSDYTVFFISLRAGGVGLNLTAADYVFLLDPWWNPAVERQATDRTHRIGQQKPIFVYKFITKDTIEEKILGLQRSKLQLSDDILENDENIVNKISVEELEELLK